MLESGFPFGNLTAYDTALGWRYPNPKMQEMYGTEAMGETAENVARQWQISRESQDAFAHRSQEKYQAAAGRGAAALPHVRFNDKAGKRSAGFRGCGVWRGPFFCPVDRPGARPDHLDRHRQADRGRPPRPDRLTRAGRFIADAVIVDFL